MKKIEAIQVEINKIQEKAQQEVEEVNTKLEAAITEHEKAANDLLKAQGGNPEEYTKAADKVRTQKDIVELYTQKKRLLETTPQITEEEYQDIKGRIIDEMDNLTQEADKKLQGILRQLNEIKDTYYQSFNSANELLRVNQRELRQIPLSERTPGGGSHTAPRNMADEYKTPEAINRLNAILLNSGYKGE